MRSRATKAVIVVALAWVLATHFGVCSPVASPEAIESPPANVPAASAPSEYGREPDDDGPTAPPILVGDRLSGVRCTRRRRRAPQPESSPFRFTDITKRGGDRLRPRLGDDRRRNTFRPPTAPASRSSTTTTTASSTSISPPRPDSPWGSSRDGPNRLYKNLGGGKFRDATEVVGPRASGGSVTEIVAGDIDNDGDADVFLCNYGSNALLPQQRRRHVQGHQQVGRGRRPQLVVRRRLRSTSTATETSTSTSPTTAAIKLPEDDAFCGDRAKGTSGSIATPG